MPRGDKGRPRYVPWSARLGEAVSGMTGGATSAEQSKTYYEQAGLYDKYTDALSRSSDKHARKIQGSIMNTARTAMTARKDIEKGFSETSDNVTDNILTMLGTMEKAIVSTKKNIGELYRTTGDEAKKARYLPGAGAPQFVQDVKEMAGDIKETVKSWAPLSLMLSTFRGLIMRYLPILSAGGAIYSALKYSANTEDFYRSLGFNSENLRNFNQAVKEAGENANVEQRLLYDLARTYQTLGVDISNANQSLGAYMDNAATLMHLTGLGAEETARWQRNMIQAGSSVNDLNRGVLQLANTMINTSMSVGEFQQAMGATNELYYQYGGIAHKNALQMGQDVLHLGQLFKSLNIDVRRVGTSFEHTFSDRRQRMMTAMMIARNLGGNVSQWWNELVRGTVGGQQAQMKAMMLEFTRHVRPEAFMPYETQRKMLTAKGVPNVESVLMQLSNQLGFWLEKVPQQWQQDQRLMSELYTSFQSFITGQLETKTPQEIMAKIPQFVDEWIKMPKPKGTEDPLTSIKDALTSMNSTPNQIAKAIQNSVERTETALGTVLAPAIQGMYTTMSNLLGRIAAVLESYVQPVFSVLSDLLAHPAETISQGILIALRSLAFLTPSAGTLAGAAAGAATAPVTGPFGPIVGGVLGWAGGMLAQKSMEENANTYENAVKKFRTNKGNVLSMLDMVQRAGAMPAWMSGLNKWIAQAEQLKEQILSGANPVAPMSFGASVKAPTQSEMQNAAIIYSIARKHGVSPVTAIATALQESGLHPNPLKPGDSGTSHGLFQLHTIGGGLGTGWSLSSLYDPVKNAEKAISHMAATANIYGGRFSTPGELAKLSQRPGDPDYIRHVNAWVPRAERIVSELERLRLVNQAQADLLRDQRDIMQDSNRSNKRKALAASPQTFSLKEIQEGVR